MKSALGISLAVVDGIGRRKALLGGIFLMALSVFSLAIFAFYQVAPQFQNITVFYSCNFIFYISQL
jgi:hypothetical protein